MLLLIGCGSVGLVENGEEPVPGRVVIEPMGKVQFGSASPHGRSVSQEVLVRSFGDAPVRIESAWTEAVSEGVFYLPSDPFPRKLDPGEEFVFEVRFLPEARGTVQGSLVLTTDDGTVSDRALVGSGCEDEDADGDC